MKIGIGYDIHRLEQGRKLYLGGKEIPFSLGLVGHSDGDCLIHAIIDALLGAMGEGDIGQLFPDTEVKYKDIRSTELLKEVMMRLKKNNFKIIHTDSIIIAEKPKLASYLLDMKKVLCPILQIKENALGIKAKTNEGLGVEGKGKAVACWATVLVKKK
ncbi:MAG: 2-C-methyl-D-erythritol 2,4-cyclodiphosphate synthase [Clostridiales bacterium]|nr:2-C-methyl-D-erythritol 2,4-cyclodiphosphate synthase [Clostridiales bacterium]